MSTATNSLWAAQVAMPAGEPLSEDTQADVCVIGAGIAGLTTALELARAGARVVVLEARDTISPGETAYTTAHLSSVIDDRFSEIERIHGERILRLAVESHRGAIDRIEEIIREEGISCDFRRVDGYLFLGSKCPADLIDREARAARTAGFEPDRLPTAPLPGARTRECLRFAGQAQFHPLNYMMGLYRAIQRRGVRISTSSPVQRVEAGQPCQVVLRSGKCVTAANVVVATNTPINDIVALHTKQAPYTTYAFAAEIPQGYVTTGLFWDTEDPYHYVRTQPGPEGKEYLIVGGEDHKTGQKDRSSNAWEGLLRWARFFFPRMENPQFRWSGQVMETVDGLAFIGPDPGGARNVFIATGDSGMGMTHGTLAGALLRDLIQGRSNPYAEVYDPSRKPLGAAGDFLRENLNVAGQYLDWVTGGDVASASEIPRGKGAIVRHGLTKLAVYRDDQNQVHECSAVCPHLGCLVRWNDRESTWDCPCHGSRFSPEGKVLHGPAVSDLEPATTQATKH